MFGAGDGLTGSPACFFAHIGRQNPLVQPVECYRNHVVIFRRLKNIVVR